MISGTPYPPGMMAPGQQPVYQQGPDGQFRQVGFMAAPGYAQAQQPVVYMQQPAPGMYQQQIPGPAYPQQQQMPSYQQQQMPGPGYQPQQQPPSKDKAPKGGDQDDKDSDGGCCLCVLCAALVAGCVVYFKAAAGME